MADKKSKVIKINESKLVDMINDIVEATIAERNLVPAQTKKAPVVKKVRVTESQLRALQAKGAKIDSIKKVK